MDSNAPPEFIDPGRLPSPLDPTSRQGCSFSRMTSVFGLEYKGFIVISNFYFLSVGFFEQVFFEIFLDHRGNGGVGGAIAID